MQEQVLLVCVLVIALAGSLVAADGTSTQSTSKETSFTVNSALGPVIIKNYTALGAVALTAQQTVQCQCQGIFTKNLKVCGTNGFTYPTACLLLSAMRLNKNLGLRCSHACPCPNLADRAVRAGGCNSLNRLPTQSGVRSLNLKIMKNPIRVFCLTDGLEETRGTVFCRMAKNSTIGIRAMGSCSEFNTYNCPSRLLQTIPMFDDSN